MDGLYPFKSHLKSKNIILFFLYLWSYLKQKKIIYGKVKTKKKSRKPSKRRSKKILDGSWSFCSYYLSVTLHYVSKRLEKHSKKNQHLDRIQKLILFWISL